MSAPVDERWAQGPGLLASAWRYKWWILLATVLAGALGYVGSSMQPTRYDATARVFLTDPRQASVFELQRSVDPQRYIPQQSERITSRPVIERTQELLSRELTTSEIARALSVEGDIELDLIEITASHGDPEFAAEIANTAATAYTEVAQEARLASAADAAQELEEAAADIDEQIAELQDGPEEAEEALADQLEILIRQRVDLTSRAQQQLVEARVFGSGVDFLESATPPAAPSSPRPRRDAILAAALGAALAAAAAYWRTGRGTTVERRTQPGEVLGVPLLGVLPLYKDTRGEDLETRISALDAEAQEAYEFLLSSIEYALAPSGARTLLITSTEPGQGKTEVALQLAVTALLQGRRALLVDGDLRVRSLTHLVDADGGPGLVDLAVSSPRQYRSYLRAPMILGGGGSLPVLPAGSTADEGAASLRQPGVRRGLKVIGEELDLVIVDSAPLLATADTTTLSSAVDAILLVVRAGTPLSELESLRERLAFVGCPVLGYAYITGDASDVGYAFGYGSYRYRHSRSTKSEVVGMADADGANDGIVDWLRPDAVTDEPPPPSRPPLAARETARPSQRDASPSDDRQEAGPRQPTATSADLPEEDGDDRGDAPPVG